jgi:hypothetical protein
MEEANTEVLVLLPAADWRFIHSCRYAVLHSV